MTEFHGNITSQLVRAAERTPEAPALVIGAHRMTFAQLDSACWAAARVLAESGTAPGDVLALRLDTQTDLAVMLIAGIRLGATPLVISPSLTETQLHELLAEAAPRFLVVSDAKKAVAGVDHIHFDTSALPAGQPDAALIDEAPAHFGKIIAGSGTTGKPLLMPLTHAMLKARQEKLRRIFDLREGQRFMLVSPLFFATPTDRFLSSVMTGATCVVWDQKTDLLPAIVAAEPDFLHLTVLHAHLMLQQSETHPGIDLSGIRKVSIGASPVSETLRADLRNRLKARLSINYGANEVGTLTFAQPEDLPKVADTVGRPQPPATLEIVDDDDQPLGPGEVGRIRIKDPGQITGYVGGARSERFRGDWFYPGDLAKWSDDGQMVHCGRADQMMILDGINIYPTEIEHVMARHPAVNEVAAFPLEHAVHQAVPVCLVSLKDGDFATPEELLAFARHTLGQRGPRQVVITAALPRNAQGKLIRSELRDLILQPQDTGRRPVEVQAARHAARPLKSKGPSRQIRRAMSLTFKIPSAVSAATLALWDPYLKDDVLPCPAADDLPSPSKAASDAEVWLGYVLMVTRALLLRSYIPCFDPIRLIRFRRREDDKSVCDVAFEMPLMEHFRSGVIRNALDEADMHLRFLNANPPEPANRERVWATMITRSVPRIAQDSRVNISTLRVLHAAYRKEIPFAHLGMGVYQLGWGAAARTISASTTTGDSALGTKLTGHKDVTAGLLRSAGLPVPNHAVVRSLDAARTAAERIGWPVVVKPADLERGEGVQVEVGPDDLEGAIRTGLGLSPAGKVLVEAQAKGVCHRLFVAHGVLLYAVKRLPIGVYGDGRQTVAQLVAAELAAEETIPPWHRSMIQPIDELARASLAAQDLTEDDVPEKGRFVALRRIESTALGGVDEDVSDRVHPENLRIALAATRLSGLTVAGIDIITEDIAEPWTTSGAVINEVNYSPLLGGAEISRQNLPAYLDRMLGGTGRIPVEVFVGDDTALTAAEARLKALKDAGVAAVLTSDAQTWDASGTEIALATTGLARRVRAMIHSADVAALLILVRNDALLNGPLPLESVDRLHVHGTPAITGDAPNRHKALMELLSSWVREPA